MATTVKFHVGLRDYFYISQCQFAQSFLHPCLMMGQRFTYCLNEAMLLVILLFFSMHMNLADVLLELIIWLLR